jgi:hypothetical protein
LSHHTVHGEFSFVLANVTIRTGHSSQRVHEKYTDGEENFKDLVARSRKIEKQKDQGAAAGTAQAFFARITPPWQSYPE